MTIVVFAEKNKAAAKLATILSGGNSTREHVADLPVYSFVAKGDKYKIIGLAGHITSYDFDPAYRDWKAIDPAVLLTADPIKNITKKNYERAVRQLAKQADSIVLACDYDREGENIGFEARDIALQVKKVPVKRARFSSLSANEVQKAFSNLVEPDTNLALSADTRQILDLRMGAAFTRFMTLAVREKAYTKSILSIGPCQTPTCGFVYEREKAIRNFKPEDFWKIEAVFQAGSSEFEGVHRKGNIRDVGLAKQIYEKLQGTREATVFRLNIKEKQINPPYPLNTNEFLKRASKFLDISPEKALEIAEQLYLAGFISYPRTETNRYPEDHDFKSMLKNLLRIGEYSFFAENLLKTTVSPRNGTKDGHDHPPIHPIKAVSEKQVKNAVKLDNSWKVYDLIVRHFLANLMDPALFEKTHMEVHVKDEPFDCKGSVMKSEGWKQVYPFEISKEKLLPPVAEGDKVAVNKITNTKSQTTPPKRLTEAELLTLMDKHGIGTKATAPSHIETNKKRGYFEIKGKTISMLDTGFNLMDALGISVPILIQPEIRAKIEGLIEDVEKGKKSFDEAISEGTVLIQKMYTRLKSGKGDIVLRIAGSIKDEKLAEDKNNHIGKCDKCGRTLSIIRTDKGRFVGCSGYPDCRNTYPLPRKGSLDVMRSRECKMGGFAVLKVGGGKYYWSVGVGPCFNCEKQKLCFPPTVIGKCPSCGCDMVLIETKDSKFLGCARRCGFTCSYPQKGRVTLRKEICEECGWKIVRVKEPKKDARHYCINRKCNKKFKNLL
ncbi:MAG: DNA topoisomerase I [Methanohalophilus sp. T328-1]|uniref:DNA topoisomerase I n=1 Tax=Methanohalophilus sp. DAL1 TaxID=1864608 RepID=UPI000793827A|nr:DNA topoisomerase [Methanohalophilus sp. DAL1]KXS46902.1 MAG: DNA topoisomerase I [Methanohalophilus sp. T328-1]OBZ34475.1 MAG: DNA topoisomerase [Methanohalophilus sp. DAL1]